MSRFQERMIRAAKLDPNLYEEVEADRGAMGQAMGVVVLSSIAAGVGTIGTIGVGGIFIGTLLALAGWYIWAYLTYFIGTRFLPEPQTRSDPKELLRTIGFSSAPGVLRVFAIVPGVGAQGGDVERLRDAAAGDAGGLVVNSSRSILYAWRDRGGDPAAAARDACEELRGRLVGVL